MTHPHYPSTASEAETFTGHPSRKARLGNVYARITELSEQVTRAPATFTGLVATSPHRASEEIWSATVRRNALLRSWHRTCLRLLAASVAGDMPPAVASALLDHLPDHIGWQHHRRLPLHDVGTPNFFRTDQSAGGTVLEVQCPGSLWGVHEIIREFYVGEGAEGVGDTAPLSALFIKSLRDRLQTEPVIHHLLDNSSHPAGERFFIQRARAGARYFGFDAVRPQECNFVRSHDFPTLLVENFASERIARLIEGVSVYDLPPAALFDQKLLLSFPFWDETRAHFDEEIRQVFPYTTVLAPEGVRLETGEWVTLAQFVKLPRNRRQYFLKYAGSDVARNWGSRAVYHLGKLSCTACAERLGAALERYAAGERWILQRGCESTEEVSFITREGRISTTTAHSKHSVFYGPNGPLGMLNMFEKFYKVHGSTETITTIAIPPKSATTREEVSR